MIAIRISRPRIASLTNSLSPDQRNRLCLQHLDQHDAQQHPEHRALAAQNADPADHHRRYNLELQPLRGGHRNVAEADQIHEIPQPGQDRRR